MAEYVSPDAVRDIPAWVALCGTLAPISSILMFLSPIPTIRQVLRTGTVGDLPLLPYTSMVASCFVWILYGILKREPSIYGTNVVEFILSVYYFVEFTNYAPKQSPTFPGSVYRHIQLVVGIWVVSLWVAVIFQENVSTIGDLTVVLTILTFASPLAAVKAVLETQSSESIPWPFTLAALLNCCLWSIVGVAEMHDIYVYLPAMLGLVFSLLQVALKLYFGDHMNDNNQDNVNPSYTRTPVDMPYPVLGSVRQVVMLGSNLPNSNYNPLQSSMEDHDLQLDMNSPSSNIDYVELGSSLQGGGGEYHHQQQQQLQQQQMPNNNHPGGLTASVTDAAQLGFVPPQTLHKLSKSNEGLESVLIDDTAVPPPPSPLQNDSFRSRSGSSSGQGHNTLHDHGF